MNEVDDVTGDANNGEQSAQDMSRVRKGVTTKVVGGAAIVMVGVAVLAACGGGTTSGKPVSSTSAAAGSSASASAGRGFGGGGFGGLFQLLQEPQVKQCLSAAGIAVPTLPARPSNFPSGARPSGSRTGRPSGFPSGARPSNFPSGSRPSGFAGGAFAQDFQKIESALTACGIKLPTFSRSAQPPAPTASGSAAAS